MRSLLSGQRLCRDCGRRGKIIVIQIISTVVVGVPSLGLVVHVSGVEFAALGGRRVDDRIAGFGHGGRGDTRCLALAVS